MKIISISGLDGSGKSTQIQMLKEYLEAQGKRVYYFHAVEYSLINTIANYCKKIFYTFLRPRESVEDKISVTRSGRTGILLRKIGLKIDLARFKNLVRNLENQGYDYMLSDRYLYDTAVNIEYLLGGSTSNWRLNLQKIIKPDLAIYLKTDPEIIMRRERSPDQGLEYLKKKENLYDAAAKRWNLIEVDGKMDKQIIFEEIRKING